MDKPTNNPTTPARKAKSPENTPTVFVCADRISEPYEEFSSYRLRLLRYAEFTLMHSTYPIAPDLMVFLNPENDDDVDSFLDNFFCRAYTGILVHCDELWAFTQDGNLTDSMRDDIEEATRHHMPVRIFTDVEVEVFLNEHGC